MRSPLHAHPDHRLRAEMEALRNTLERLACGTPLNRFLEELCLSLEGLLEDGRCSVLRLDEEGRHMRHGAGPSLSSKYLGLVDGVPIGPNAGSCGTAMFRRQMVVVEDIATDPLWNGHSEAPLAFGLKACASVPIMGPTGHPLGAFAIYLSEPGPFAAADLALLQRFTDIAALAIRIHQRDERLRQVAQNLQAIMDQASDGIFVADESTRYIDANHRALEMVGYELEELTRLHIRDLIVPEERDLVPQRLQRLEDGRPYMVERILLRKDESRFLAEISARKLEDGRYLSICRDVTEREEARKLRARSEQSFRQLFNLNPAPMVLSRPSDGTILLANEAAYRMFRLTPEEVEHHRTVDFFAHPEDRQALLAEIADKGGVRDFELEMVVHGERRKVLLSAAVPDYLGEKAILVALTDITDRAREEEAQRQSQKLESLGLLAGGIAHDFNNLLTSMLGNLGLAQLHLPEGSASAPYLGDTEVVMQRAADLARQMLAYSGRGRFRQEQVDVNQLVREMTRLLSVGIPKRILLNLDLDPGLPRVQGDPVQLQQVVMNLVTNAAEAIGDRNGSIRIRTGLHHLDARERNRFAVGKTLPDGEYLCLEVEDSGSGMAPEVVARIFDPFFTTKSTGRGLGLSALMGILNGHKAGLSIETALEKGTTFQVWLSPLAEGAEGPAQTLPVSSPSIYQGRVLMVDDEDSVLSSTGSLLQHLGFEVEEARDGKEALDRLGDLSGACELILLDLTMPRMDGRETLGHIRARWPHIPVILSSGYSEQAGTLDLGGPGAYLPKPYRLAELKDALAKALGR